MTAKDILHDSLATLLADMFENNVGRAQLENFNDAIEAYKIAGGKDIETFRLISKFYEMICLNRCYPRTEEEFYNRFGMVGRDDD